MRNHISAYLLVVGIAIAAIGFIVGLTVSLNTSGPFATVSFLYWALPALAVGALLVGLSEIINLLQRMLDHNGAASSRAERPSPERSSLPPQSEPADPNPLTKISGLTILYGSERFKGSFWIDNRSLKLMKHSVFSSEPPELVAEIDKRSISPQYKPNNDYYMFALNDSEQTFGFKTFTVHDYERIVRLLLSPSGE